jgi:hypothetical protein
MRYLFYLLVIVGSFLNVTAQTGIGTTAPVNKLEVVTTKADPATTGVAANGNLRLGATVGTHVLDFGLSSTSTYSWLQARDKSNYATNYFLSLNPNGGNVGIGTTSPLTTLTVGNVGGTVPGEIALNPTSTQYEGGQITFKKSLVGSTVDWTIDQYGSTSANARFRIFNGTSETNGLAILENGNLGIGTISPTARLNIAGGGIRIATGFGNATTRPALNTGSVGSYEIRGVGAGGGGTAQSDASDDGFLRLSAGGGTNTNTQASIDLSGYSTVADMSSTIVMRTLGTERLRIDPYGKVGLGTSSPATSLHIENGNTFGNPGSTSSPSIYLYNTNNASSTANSTISVRTAGTGSGKPYYSLDVNGAFGYSMGINNPTDQMILNTSWDFNTTATNNAIIINRTGQSRVIIPASAGTYVTDWPSGWGGGLATFDFSCAGIYYNTLAARSDKRLKNTITTITNDLIAKYLQLRPVSYYWNQDRSRDTKLQYGLIAQEVETLFPEMVNTGTDEMQTKSVNYQALHALSLKVIQSQQAEIEDLKKKQADMEARLLQLEAKLK